MSDQVRFIKLLFSLGQASLGLGFISVNLATSATVVNASPTLDPLQPAGQNTLPRSDYPVNRWPTIARPEVLPAPPATDPTASPTRGPALPALPIAPPQDSAPSHQPQPPVPTVGPSLSLPEAVPASIKPPSTAVPPPVPTPPLPEAVPNQGSTIDPIEPPPQSIPTLVPSRSRTRSLPQWGSANEFIRENPYYFFSSVTIPKYKLSTDATPTRLASPNRLNLPQTTPPTAPPTPPNSTSSGDPELGVLKLQPQSSPSDPELGNLRIETASSNPADPELGVLRLQEIPPKGPPTLPPPPPPPKHASVYLQGRLDYFRSNNVFSSLDSQADGLIRSGLTLFYAPALGKKTYLITSIDGNLIRYGNISRLNYNELRLRAGIWQQLSPNMFAELDWSSQKLYTAQTGLQDPLSGDRFFNDNSVSLDLSRSDKLSPKLTLSTFYQIRMSFASPNNPEFNDPLNRSRLINTFVGSLNYNLSPSSVMALDYQYAWSHYTQQARDDHYHQLLARFTYTFTPSTQFNLFGGYSFGNSSETLIKYNSFIFGVGLSFNLPLF